MSLSRPRRDQTTPTHRDGVTPVTHENRNALRERVRREIGKLQSLISDLKYIELMENRKQLRRLLLELEKVRDALK